MTRDEALNTLRAVHWRLVPSGKDVFAACRVLGHPPHEYHDGSWGIVYPDERTVRLPLWEMIAHVLSSEDPTWTKPKP